MAIAAIRPTRHLLEEPEPVGAARWYSSRYMFASRWVNGMPSPKFDRRWISSMAASAAMAGLGCVAASLNSAKASAPDEEFMLANAAFSEERERPAVTENAQTATEVMVNRPTSD